MSTFIDAPPVPPRHASLRSATQTHAAAAAQRPSIWRRAAESRPAAVRDLRIGLLGLGQVGQAVVQSAGRHADAFAAIGLRPVFTAVLVRDENKTRGVVDRESIATITADPDAFLRREYDVVIEVLGGVKPATRLVTALLERGIPVVTANKALLAARAPELLAAAERGRTWLRAEASVLAGVPLLGTLRSRPLAARVQRLEAILNGTSNFVLSAIDREGRTLESALQLATELGYAEPDASRDLGGHDAADKLVVLLQHLGLNGVRPGDFERSGIESLRPGDLRAARALGGRIKPVAVADLDSQRPTAFVGPAFVPQDHPLANIDREQNGVRLEGPEIGALLHAGPGAGPDVTAAAILDDVLEGLQTAAADLETPGEAACEPAAARHPVPHSEAIELDGPQTGWFVRFEFRQPPPTAHEIADFLSAFSIWFARWHDGAATRGTLYGLTLPAGRPQIVRALNALADATGGRWFAIRALEGDHAGE
jgi:homoserine dehydrogenase